MNNDFFVIRYKDFAKCLHKDEYATSYLRDGSLFLLYNDTECHNSCDVLISRTDEDMINLRHIQRNIRMWQKTLAREVADEKTFDVV